jgi:hypothetical protein
MMEKLYSPLQQTTKAYQHANTGRNRARLSDQPFARLPTLERAG